MHSSITTSVQLDVFQRGFNQLKIVQSDGDTAYFHHLLYLGELIAKVATAGMCSAVQDDSDRHRYALIYRLVRADGIGEWAQVLDEVVNGPTSRLLLAEAQDEKRELTARSTSETWQYRSISLLDACLRQLRADRQGLPAKLEGRTWFATFAELRNATRGHGVLQPSLCAQLSPLIEDSLKLFIDNFPLFRREWVYLHKNLSGKYRVTPISFEANSFRPLKSSEPQKWGILPDGVYIFFGKPVRIELLYSDADLTDYFLPNGNFRSKYFETISYLTNSKRAEPSTLYLIPATQLPKSETEAAELLGVTGETFTNLPQPTQGYVPRVGLEQRLYELLMNDRHPIISLIGRGGIGKTSLALHVLQRIANNTRFTAILWFSSRDIDLLPSGPKPVRPHLLNERDMAKEFMAVTRQLITVGDEEKALSFFSTALTNSPLGGPILYVFDNFETVSNPVQVYNWVDTYVRNPNKILITSRFREFKGDYAVDVLGMEESEALSLINQVSQHLGIANIVNSRAATEIYRESDGHPYVIKILLGEVARQRKLVQVERLIAGKDEILDALFERSFSKLSPAAQLVFLTLSSWRSVIPRVAIEAVMLRPANDKLDVEAALDELEQSSFIEVIADSDDGQEFISVPLSAATFGKRKLESSALKASVDANMQILLFFGAGQRGDLQKGIGPRVDRFFRKVAETAKDESKFQQYLPILEYISRRYARGWLLLARLYEEGGNDTDAKAAMDAVRRFIEASKSNIEDRRTGWQLLVRLAKARGDVITEIQAMIELSSLPLSPFDTISDAANRLNIVNKSQVVSIPLDERRLLSERLLKIAEARMGEADATDLSRFAWLCLSLNDEDKARRLVLKGLELDPENDYCVSLAERLAIKAPDGPPKALFGAGDPPLLSTK
jgi:hypothetical protein